MSGNHPLGIPYFQTNQSDRGKGLIFHFQARLPPVVSTVNDASPLGFIPMFDWHTHAVSVFNLKLLSKFPILNDTKNIKKP